MGRRTPTSTMQRPREASSCSGTARAAGSPRRISSRRRRWRSRRASPWRSSNSPTGSRADAHLRPRRSSMPRGRPSSRRSAGAGSTSCRSSSEDARRARASPAGRPVRRGRRVSSASRSHSSRPRARDRSRGRAASMSSTRSRSRLSSSRASEILRHPARGRSADGLRGAGRPQPATGARHRSAARCRMAAAARCGGGRQGKEGAMSEAEVATSHAYQVGAIEVIAVSDGERTAHGRRGVRARSGTPRISWPPAARASS